MMPDAPANEDYGLKVEREVIPGLTISHPVFYQCNEVKAFYAGASKFG